MFRQGRKVNLKRCLPDHAQRACVHQQRSIRQARVKIHHLAFQPEMREQTCRLQTVARNQNDFADIRLRQSEEHCPRCAPCTNDNSRFTRYGDIRNGAIKAANVGIGRDKRAGFIAKHRVNRADRVAHITGVSDKIERRNLVRYRDIAPAPCGIGRALGKITLQIIG